MHDTDLSVLIKKSFQRTWKILFKPFVFKKWLFLLLIAYLSGNLGGGCGNGGSGSWDRREKKAEAAPSYMHHLDQSRGTPTTNAAPSATTSQINATPVQLTPAENFLFDWRQWPKWIYFLILLGIFLILAIIILFTWISSRFQFVWFDAIVKDDASVIKPFGDYALQGNSLFKLNLAVLFMSFLIMAGIGVWIWIPLSAHGVFQNPDQLPFLGYFKIIAPPVFILIFLFIAVAIFMHLINEFVVVIMAMDQLPFLEGWRRFCEIYRQNTKDIWIYLITRFGLGIAAALIAALATFFILVVAGLLGVVIGGFFYLIFGVLLKLKVVFFVLMFIIGVPLGAALILLIIMLGLPIAVFFKNFSLYYFSSLDGLYKPLALADPEN